MPEIHIPSGLIKRNKYGNGEEQDTSALRAQKSRAQQRASQETDTDISNPGISQSSSSDLQYVVPEVNKRDATMSGITIDIKSWNQQPLTSLPVFNDSTIPLDTLLIPHFPTPHSQLYNNDEMREDVLCIFIPGNPGLISYYTEYLSELATKLAQDDPPNKYTIFGLSHAGFNTSKEIQTILHVGKHGFETKTNKKTRYESRIHTLQEIINMEVDILEKIWQQRPGLKIVLMGHSVGGYILMEILRTLNERYDGKCMPGRITGGILLFPTITHISKSPSGRLSTPILKHIPYWPMVINYFAKAVFLVMPTILLNFLLQLFLPHFPSSGKSTTKSFLLSPLGVYQSLCLAREEMLDINEDCWKDDIWGSELLKNPQTELFFYYGAKDHWVADAERDLIIEKRGRGAKRWVEAVKDGHADEDEVQMLKGRDTEDGWKPRMMVCEEDIPHGFCISHSKIMSDKTARWIIDIVNKKQPRGTE